MRKTYKPVCNDCGNGDNVYRTAVSYWSVDRQCWVEERMTEEWLCSACGDCDIDMVEVQVPRTDMDDLLDNVFAVVAKRTFKEEA